MGLGLVLPIRSAEDELWDQVSIITNWGVQTLDDIINCIETTGGHGTKSSVAMLECPILFSLLEIHSERKNKKRIGPGRIVLAKEYLKIAEELPPDIGGEVSSMNCV